MNKLNYIFRNINLLNIMLITTIIILANYTFLSMFDINGKYTLPAGKKIVIEVDEKPAESHIPSPSDYTMIAEENLFHPERRIPVEKAEGQPQPEFVLYGILITDNKSLVYLEDLKAPVSSPGRGKRQTVLKKGDTLSGFTLKDIEADKVVMVKGEETVMVYLNDPRRPKTRETSGPATTAAPSQPLSTVGQPSVIQPTTIQPSTRMQPPLSPRQRRTIAPPNTIKGSPDSMKTR